MFSALLLGLVPDQQGAVVLGRKNLCEALAVHCSVALQQGDVASLEAGVKSICKRNPDILSAGVRKADGRVLIDVGNHTGAWQATDGEQQSEARMQVPISFKSQRAPDEKETEFVRSSDNWFRPTMLKTGPDGALYIADMYRLVLEHPEWIPPAIQQRLDLRAGSDKGRIYRVYPEGAKLRKVPRLDKLDTAGLVAALESPNGWQRDTAERLLAHKRDKSAEKPLRELIASTSKPKARLQALSTLNVLGLLTPDIAVAALKDSHPAIREAGIQFCEPFLSGKERAKQKCQSH